MALVTLAVALAVPARRASPAPPLNLLVVSIDTLRRDAVGCYRRGFVLPLPGARAGR